MDESMVEEELEISNSISNSGLNDEDDEISNDEEIQDDSESRNINKNRIGFSVAWEYFTKSEIEVGVASCNVCASVLKLPSETTTPMFNHLKAKHQKEWQDCSSKKRKCKEEQNEQCKKLKPAMNKTQKKILDEAVMRFPAQDLEGFSTVNGQGFKNLMNTAVPDYELPHRTTFSRTIGPELYEKTRKQLMENLHEDFDVGLKSISFTTDCWTSRAGNSYISLTAHYITQEFEPKHITLGIRQIEESHTAATLREVLEEMMEEWGLLNISNVATFVVTDNARNITAAVSQAGWHNIRCFAHTLQLVLNDSKKYVTALPALLQKARRIAIHFHHSDRARRELIQAQDVSNNNEALHLVQMIDTRWNTEYLMLKRMIQLKNPLSQVLANNTTLDNLNGREWKSVEEILEVMEPLYEATVLSSSKQYPTLSMIIPIVETLKNLLSQKSSGIQNRSSIGRQLANFLIEFLDTRFQDRCNGELYGKCTFLDPRYKNHFFSEGTLQKIQENLTGEIVTMQCRSGREEHSISSSVTTEADNILSHAVTKRPMLLDFLDEVRLTQQLPQGDEELKREIEREIITYNQERRILQQEDSLKWWKKEMPKYPLLSQMAMRYLSIPATSVESERLFSSAGDIVTQKRVSLNPETVEMLVFLHKNLNYGRL